MNVKRKTLWRILIGAIAVLAFAVLAYATVLNAFVDPVLVSWNPWVLHERTEP